MSILRDSRTLLTEKPMNTIEAIRKEIERRIHSIKNCPFITAELGAKEREIGEVMAYKDILSFLSTLESEKPVPNDLEEAAMNYIAPIENEDGLKVINFSGQDIADAFIAGAKWQKEQMMKDAVEVPLYLDGDFLTVDYNFKELGYKDGDEVKLIIIRP